MRYLKLCDQTRLTLARPKHIFNAHLIALFYKGTTKPSLTEHVQAAQSKNFRTFCDKRLGWCRNKLHLTCRAKRKLSFSKTIH